MTDKLYKREQKRNSHKNKYTHTPLCLTLQQSPKRLHTDDSQTSLQAVQERPETQQSHKKPVCVPAPSRTGIIVASTLAGVALLVAAVVAVVLHFRRFVCCLRRLPTHFHRPPHLLPSLPTHFHHPPLPPHYPPSPPPPPSSSAFPLTSTPHPHLPPQPPTPRPPSSVHRLP